MEHMEILAIGGAHAPETDPAAEDGEEQATPHQRAPRTLTSSPVTVHVDGLTCGMCIGDVMQRVHHVPGVVEVSVGPIDHGQSWVTITSDPGVGVTELESALSRGGFHIAPGGQPRLAVDDYESHRQMAMATAARAIH